MFRKFVAPLFIVSIIALQPLAALRADPTGTPGISPVRVPSSVSFERTVDNLRKLVSKNGMMVMGEVNHGKIMSMTGMQIKATSFLIGSPMVGKKLFGEDVGAAVAAPFRVTVFEDGDGQTFITYFRPSDLLASFDSRSIPMVAGDLDQKLQMLTGMAGK